MDGCGVRAFMIELTPSLMYKDETSTTEDRRMPTAMFPFSSSLPSCMCEVRRPNNRSVIEIENTASAIETARCPAMRTSSSSTFAFSSVGASMCMRIIWIEESVPAMRIWEAENRIVPTRRPTAMLPSLIFFSMSKSGLALMKVR